MKKAKHKLAKQFVAAQKQSFETYRLRWNVVVQWQCVASALVLLVLFLLRGIGAVSDQTLRGQYQELFERADYAPSLLRFVQKGGQAVALEVFADAPPEGYSLALYETEQNFCAPVEMAQAVVSSNYGWRKDPFDGGDTFHGGVDFAAAEGSVVCVVMDGVVEKNYCSESYGNCVFVRHQDGSESVYAHLQYAFVKVGEVVQMGDLLGTVGQTGRATGAHLHLEIRKEWIRQDPSVFCAAEWMG